MKVKVYASTANLGPGFDCLGAALDIYNEYEFEKSDSFILEGFDRRYDKEDNNLIITSYKRLFTELNEKVIPIRLLQKKADIPTSRGMGSSAACIVAGLLMANRMLNNKADEDFIFQTASAIEGHPDNVAPVIFSGVTCSFKEEDKYYTVKLDLHPSYIFTVVIPDMELSTALARSVIKKEVSLSDATYNVSHGIATIKALETGDFEMLKKAMKDKLHQPYRFPLIKGADKVTDIAKRNGAICIISGAGSTMLVISKESMEKTLKESLDESFKVIEVKVTDKKSAVYEEE